MREDKEEDSKKITISDQEKTSSSTHSFIHSFIDYNRFEERREEKEEKERRQERKDRKERRGRRKVQKKICASGLLF